MIDHLILWNAHNIFRIIVALLAFFLTGGNLVFVTHAKQLFKPDSYRVWRLLFLSKTAISLYIGLVIWQQKSGPLYSVRLIYLLVAEIVALYALIRLYKLRANVTLRPKRNHASRQASL